MALFEGAGEVTNLDVADMREQMAERSARLGAPAAPGSSRSPPATGSSGSSPSSAPTSSPAARPSTPRPTSCWPGSTGSPAEEVLVLPSSSNVIMAAERACELSEKPARVVPRDLPAGEPAGAGRARPRGRADGERRAARGGARRGRHRRRRPGRPRRRPGPLPQGDAVGFAGGEIVAWGGAGSTLTATIQHLAEGAEIVTVIAGEGAPIPLAEIDTHVPDGVEVEKHEGGQPSWWWLLAAQ